MTITTQTILSLIKNGDTTVLLGNGYNNRIRDITNGKRNDIPPSWLELVRNVNNSLQVEIDIPKDTGGITYPELFTAISIAFDIKSGRSVHSILPTHKAVVEELKDHTYKGDEIKQFASRLKKWGIPIITTNYDKQLEDSLKLNKMKMDKGPRISPYYPIGIYYASSQISDPKKDFAIWHCNGVTDYIPSLRLDLSDYCNYTSWLKTRIPLYDGKIGGDKGQESFENSWLSPFFNNQILIIGFDLNPSEFVLRWLLSRRFIWRKEQKGAESHGYYVCTKKDLSPGKQLFLDTAGINVLSYDNWDQMYGELFGL